MWYYKLSVIFLEGLKQLIICLSVPDIFDVSTINLL